MDKPTLLSDNYLDSNGLLIGEAINVLDSELEHGDVSVLLSDEDWDESELEAMHSAQKSM